MRNKKNIVVLVIIILMTVNPVSAEQNYDVIKLRDGISPYGNHAYNDGLIPVMYDGSKSENGNWAYLTEEGDLFSHRYASGFEYSEGLTPIVKEDLSGDRVYLKLGYMDKKGNVIIEPIYDVYSSGGITFAGRFLDGSALVFKYDESKKESHSIPGYWYRIDRKGNRIDENEIIETKDLLFGDNEKTKRIYNDKYSVNYDEEETVNIFGESIKKVRFNKNKALISIGEGKNRGSYIISKKSKDAEKLKAKKSKQNIVLDGKSVDVDSYLIEGNNYFKLRDIAFLVDGSEKQFEVKWNKETEDIELYIDKPYTKVGGEMKSTGKKVEVPKTSKSLVYLDGEEVRLRAYKIAGNNYFRLRDVGRIIDFGVEWDNPTNTVNINTRDSYTE